MEQQLRIAVLMGGPSAEHDVSLATGRKVIEALDPDRYIVHPVVISRERQWMIPSRVHDESIPRLPQATLAGMPGLRLPTDGSAHAAMLVAHSETEALAALQRGVVDAAFIALHGEYGEDGTVQGLLEAIGVPYTGSGVLASALGIDKPRSMMLFDQAGLAVPEFFVVHRGAADDIPQAVAHAAQAFGVPTVVKPANRGSSVGVTIARTAEELGAGIEQAFGFADTALVQRYISGTELTCGVVETPEGLAALQPTQIIPRERAFFDYYSKYTPGASEEITPPLLPPEIIRHAQETALVAHETLGCSGMSRTDMILGEDGELYVLELNTIPGMTETSLLPQAAAAVGIPFPRLLDYLIVSALQKFQRR
ncbi:D-alanine--D-alanine ligase [Candidatus Parcubacteria bacterium]|nr:MAG: D-alanine--D-alanine ligase [Candidatus Parcubacteria bacterium]